jgi:hypothetical protein
MIKNLSNIDNKKLNLDYKKMISEMYEDVYKFKPGLKLGFKTKRVSLIDKKTFNFFGMYNRQIYVLHKEIKDIVKEFCLEKQINFERNYFYILANIIENNKIPLNTYLNFAPNYKTTFVGFYIIESNNDSMTVESDIVQLEPGTLMILNSETKIMFKEMSKDLTILSFNISPLEYLYKQYYQKWIPLV